jgi:hypothetical protein
MPYFIVIDHMSLTGEGKGKDGAGVCKDQVIRRARKRTYNSTDSETRNQTEVSWFRRWMCFGMLHIYSA